jgi:hypothetical protein
MPFFIRLNPIWILVERAGFFSALSHESEPQLHQQRTRMRVLSEVATYPCIDNQYGVKERTRVGFGI